MARPDQALSFHHVGGFRYELSGLRTGSVRDQILRAQLLVERLLARNDLSDDPLLVIGGGAAGVTGALTASRLGRDVTLLEEQLNPFQTQARVTTRWLDPTEFDWPQPHWTTADMAWAGSVYRLPYRANWADQLATQWTTMWYSVVGPAPVALPPGSGSIEEFTGVDARMLTIADTSTGLRLAPWPAYGSAGRPYCAAISCVGFSGELTSVRSTGGVSLEGPAFWSTDALGVAHLGITPPSGRPIRVLVSGGGDGAQQDFLRVLTGNFGKRLFDALGLDKLKLDLADVLLAEDSARRAHAWGAPGSPPVGAYGDWHAAYESLADTVWAIWTSKPASIPALRPLLNPNVEVTWIVADAAPGYSYGLNRLLVILVARLHATFTGRPLPKAPSRGYKPSGNEVYLAGFVLDNVVPAGAAHVCGPACYGIEHEVNVAARVPFVAPGVHSLGKFDVIVVRHGVNQRPLFSAAPVSEQLSPFDLPS
ncbi:MAG: hypothetical protein KF863_17715 [Rubrivivax sp.]|jgi:hypothetical protein|nr:hypothetical protein [Rubrivivax sp.]